jgi:hypothetical protein
MRRLCARIQYQGNDFHRAFSYDRVAGKPQDFHAEREQISRRYRFRRRKEIEEEGGLGLREPATSRPQILDKARPRIRQAEHAFVRGQRGEEPQEGPPQLRIAHPPHSIEKCTEVVEVRGESFMESLGTDGWCEKALQEKAQEMLSALHPETAPLFAQPGDEASCKRLVPLPDAGHDPALSVEIPVFQKFQYDWIIRSGTVPDETFKVPQRISRG